jgi:hypothetical protein
MAEADHSFQLPPLPSFVKACAAQDRLMEPTYVAKRMQDYGRECAEKAAEAERERFIRILESREPSDPRSVNWSQEDHVAFILLGEIQREVRDSE